MDDSAPSRGVRRGVSHLRERLICLLTVLVGFSALRADVAVQACRKPNPEKPERRAGALSGSVLVTDPDYTTGLHIACGKGDLEYVREALDEGADVNAKDKVGWTPIQWAVYGCQRDVLDLLLQHGAEVDVRSPTASNETLLHLTTNLDIAERLLANGVNPNTVDWRGKTALHVAAFYSDCAYAEFLIQNGANVDARDEEGRTPLNLALAVLPGASPQIAQRLLELGADPQAEDDTGYTPLLRAAWLEIQQRDLPRVLQALEAKGEAPIFPELPRDAIRLVESMTARLGQLDVVVASMRGDLARVEACVKADHESLNRRSGIGHTPLYSACLGGHKKLVEHLLGWGAEARGRSVGGKTPLHAAAMMERRAIAAFLLAHGADVNARDDNGGTPLHAAVWSEEFRQPTLYWMLRSRDDSLPFLRFLLVNGANVNAKDNDGRTPLHLATMRRNSIDAALFLMRKGADINARDDKGLTPLGHAERHRNISTVRLLRRWGGVK